MNAVSEAFCDAPSSCCPSNLQFFFDDSLGLVVARVREQAGFQEAFCLSHTVTLKKITAGDSGSSSSSKTRRASPDQ